MPSTTSRISTLSPSSANDISESRVAAEIPRKLSSSIAELGRFKPDGRDVIIAVYLAAPSALKETEENLAWSERVKLVGERDSRTAVAPTRRPVDHFDKVLRLTLREV